MPYIEFYPGCVPNPLNKTEQMKGQRCTLNASSYTTKDKLTRNSCLPYGNYLLESVTFHYWNITCWQLPLQMSPDCILPVRLLDIRLQSSHDALRLSHNDSFVIYYIVLI